MTTNTENAARMATERRIVTALLAHLAAAGFTPVHVDDGGDEPVPAATPAEVLAAVFAVDDSTLTLRNAAGRRHWVRLIAGNGADIISDNGDDRGPFTAAMDAFDPYRFEN